MRSLPRLKMQALQHERRVEQFFQHMPPRHVIGLYDLDNGRNGEVGHWRGDNGAAQKGEKGAATTLRSVGQALPRGKVKQ
jgi:hypothetical protein